MQVSRLGEPIVADAHENRSVDLPSDRHLRGCFGAWLARCSPLPDQALDSIVMNEARIR